MHGHWRLLAAALKVCAVISVTSFTTVLSLRMKVDPYGIQTDNFLGQKLNGPSAFGKADLRIIRVLGGGGAGSGMDIALGKYKEKYAFVKCVAYSANGREIPGRRSAINKEIKAFQILYTATSQLTGMRAVGRENVSEPYIHFGIKDSFCFVYSYDGATNSRQYTQAMFLKQRVDFLQDVAKQILLGAAYMHNAGLIHNDLKPDNVMISFPYPNDPTRPKATIIDFDLASPISVTNGKIALETNKSGSPPFIPPEIYQNIAADPTKKDAWAIGVTLYFLMTGKYLFPLDGYQQQSIANTLNTGIPPQTFHISHFAGINAALKPVIDVMKALLVPNPEQRPSPSSYLASLRRTKAPARRLSGLPRYKCFDNNKYFTML
ncbi:kinase-like domain-containing protein [Syncephalis fuscata]|nr:kinase-like domain-containing protein [Syncephalis fuscata]